MTVENVRTFKDFYVFTKFLRISIKVPQKRIENPKECENKSIFNYYLIPESMYERANNE